MQVILREDFFKALGVLGNPNTNPFQGKVDVPILGIGSLWVRLWLNPQQIQTLTDHGISVGNA
jgi:hypothetical protein